MMKLAIEKANRLVGGWPDEDAIIAMLEGLSWDSPAGYVHIRADNHQGYKDGITGYSMNTKDYPFPVPDPRRIISVPIRNITAPPGYPKGEPTATFKWIEETWPQATA
jgi:branched-chain amino acid transport system substrate-binding protein